VFQHFYFVAINVHIADGNPRVGFQFLQKLPETNKICLSGCLDHAPIVSRALPDEKQLSTPKKSSIRFCTAPWRLRRTKMPAGLRAGRLQT
jgi:hypothetical protein